MEALDGNAIAGQLLDVFGVELTTAIATCATCGEVGHVAEFVVYVPAPGTVAHCRSCGSVLVVVTTIRDVNCVDLGGLADIRFQ
jgi:uncharacterized protein DUF6510